MTKIEWTKNADGTQGETWNFLVGCDKISAGCKNCYAIQTANIRMHNPNPKIQKKFAGTVKKENGKLNWTGQINFDEETLLKPLKNKKPTTYFVNSLSDLFHENVKDEWIDKAFAVMALTPQHTYQILTKRPERMKEYFDADRKEKILKSHLEWIEATERDKRGMFFNEKSFFVTRSQLSVWWRVEKQLPLANVWLGVSVENQKAADERISLLLEIPAAIRFLSCEPLLEEVDLSNYLDAVQFSHDNGKASIYKNKIDWVIVGGESGHGARPCDISWIRSIVRQCKSFDVAVFVKQLGSNSVINYYDDLREEMFMNDEDWTPIDWDENDGQPPLNTLVKYPKKDKKGGTLEEFPIDLQRREMPKEK